MELATRRAARPEHGERDIKREETERARAREISKISE
jgi:hypothetical protein